VVDLIIEQQQFSHDIDRSEFEHRLGFDVPVYVQYGRWLGNVFHGNLGQSLWTNVKVTDGLIGKIPVTLELGILGLLVSQLIALPIGVYSAIRQDTVGDYIARSFAVAAIALPSFWLGTLIMVFPSVWWGWSPPMVYVSFLDNPSGNLQIMIIPAIILGMVTSGITMRMTRTMMLEVLRQDYIRTAWSKGLGERLVVLRHAVRNAMIPVVTIVGLQLPVLVGGAVVIEQIFNLPGIGRYMLAALSARDYPIISGVNLFVATFVLIINLAVDLTYGFMDPRVRYR
jgi:peptide/nickel transport system permease protein